jgi:hypothetical protein
MMHGQKNIKRVTCLVYRYVLAGSFVFHFESK